MASLLYGAGLRPLGCCRLRVKDVDFDRREITVRGGKGGRDRLKLLPERLTAPLAAHLERVPASTRRTFVLEPGAWSCPRRSSASAPAPLGVGLAVGVSGHAALCGRTERTPAPAPLAR